jgi:hypothetical protein
MGRVEQGQREYIANLKVNGLRRAVFGQTDPAASDAMLKALQAAEAELVALQQQRTDASDDAGGTGIEVRGAETTGLEVDIVLRMAHLPTSIYHLFDRADHPLVSCTVKNVHDQTRRLRVTSFVEGYSARAVDTVELDCYDEVTLGQLPTLFPDRLRDIHELAGGTVNVLIEDLDGKIELHRTLTIPVLARTTAPLAVLDPSTGRWADLSRYLGAYVTPNAPAVMSFLRQVADHHPQAHLLGYQGERDDVPPQLKAIFEALKAAGITYVNSLIAFSPDDGTATQRVRLPSESLADKEANCVDGTVLVASLLEAFSMSAVLVVVPGHAFVGWETWESSGEWRYLETTMIASATFEEACASAEQTASHYSQLKAQTGDESRFRVWPLHTLRSVHHITPME